jgi:glutathione-specific gamma-glutamylcyclotransferase
VETRFGSVEALTVIADRTSEHIRPDLTREEQVRYIATGAGFLGTSLQYVENIAGHFAALEIEDDEVAELLAEAREYAKQQTETDDNAPQRLLPLQEGEVHR